jgi:hypothetical protein
VWLPILALLLTSVCNVPRALTPAPTPEPTGYLIPPTTKVMDAGLQAALESVLEDGTLVFSSSTPLLGALEAGDVLVADATEAAPYGLLRKVRTVRSEGAQVLVETEDAELIEAVHEGQLSFERELLPEDIRTTWLAPGVTFQTPGMAGPAKAHLLSLPPERPGLRLQALSYSIDTDFGTGGKVRVVGSAGLEPKLETDLNISCNQKIFGACAEIPDLNFKTRIGIVENVSLAVKGDATSFNKRVEIARHEFSAFTLWIGPVPVVFVPILSVYLQGDGSLTSTVDYSVGQKLTLAAGFSYNSDTGFKDLSEASFDFMRPTPAFNGQVDVRAVVGGEFKLLLYGVIGPFASLEAGPRFRASVYGLPSEPGVLWRAEGCIWLFAGIDSVKVIKLRYQKELYNACVAFGDGLNQPPGVSIQSPNQGTQIYQGERVKLRLTVFDPDGQQLSCRWTSDPGGDPFPLSGCEPANVEFASAGSRKLTLTASDPLGANGTASVTVNVLPPPTILVNIESPPDGGTVGPDESITLSASASGGEAPYKYRWNIAYPTDAAGSGGNSIQIGSGASLAWAPSNSISFAGCEVNAYGRLIVEVEDANDFSGSRSIVIAIMRIC